MTNFDGSAICEVERLTQAAEPVLTVPCEQKGVYFLRQADGNYKRQHAELDPQGAALFDLASFIAEAKNLNDDQAARRIFVRDDAVVALADNGDPANGTSPSVRWSLSLALPLHPAFVLLSNLKRLQFFTQKELVRILRTELSRYVEPTTIALFANIKTASSTEGSSSVTPQSQALDRQIQKKVQAANGGEMPEMITFSVPVYDLPESRKDAYIIHAYVEFDHDTEKFGLIVVHDELREAQEAAVQKIIAELRAELTTEVLYGKPSN